MFVATCTILLRCIRRPPFNDRCNLRLAPCKCVWHIVNVSWILFDCFQLWFSPPRNGLRCSFHISNTVVAAATAAPFHESSNELYTIHILSIRCMHARLRLVHGAGVDCNWKMVICYKWKWNFHTIDNLILHVMKRVCIKIPSFSNRFTFCIPIFSALPCCCCSYFSLLTQFLTGC